MQNMCCRAAGQAICKANLPVGAKNADMLPVERLCQIMDVSPRGYRAYRNRPLSQSQRKDMVVLARMREQFALSLGSYALHDRVMRSMIPRVAAPA